MWAERCSADRLEWQVFFLALKLEFKLLDEDPNLDSFRCENGTIQNMVEGSYFAVVRRQGLAYAVMQDGDIVGYCMIKVGAVEYEDPDAYDESDNQYGAIFIKYIIVDKPVRGQKIGSTMMNALIQAAKDFSAKLPIRLLVIDALTEYCSWYEMFGFQFLTEKNECSATNAMFIDFINREQLEAYMSAYDA